ncbi:uncharacterized protein O9250_010952 isoform 2-T2 [Rhynochetos jubatus]
MPLPIATQLQPGFSLDQSEMLRRVTVPEELLPGVALQRWSDQPQAPPRTETALRFPRCREELGWRTIIARPRHCSAVVTARFSAV